VYAINAYGGSPNIAPVALNRSARRIAISDYRNVEIVQARI